MGYLMTKTITNDLSYFSIHNHSEFSNDRLLDSITPPDELIQYAVELGLKGIALTDHETLSGHVKFIKAYKELKKKKKIPEDFKIALGNEIYLVDEDNIDELKDNYYNREERTKFYHFLLLAKNKEGYNQLKELSSLAWENSFRTGKMVRVPTFKEDLARIIKGGHVMATSACLGGFLPQMILKWQEAEKKGNQEEIDYYKLEIHEFILFNIDVFGKENFFFEIQPSDDPEQHIVNQKLVMLSEVYGIDYVVATDSHYLKKEDREIHKIYLQSQEGEREVDAFYASCYVFPVEEILESMSKHLPEDVIVKAIQNTMKIYEQIEFFDLQQKTIIPEANIEEFEFTHEFKEYYNRYEYIKKYIYSEYEIDRYFIYLIKQGIRKFFYPIEESRYDLHTILNRVNTELRELYLISKKLGGRMSSYYVLTRQVVLDIMWKKSDTLVGIGRGSAAGFLINYLLEIVQINPLDYDLPHFRHLTAERPELPDCKLRSSMLVTA